MLKNMNQVSQESNRADNLTMMNLPSPDENINNNSLNTWLIVTRNRARHPSAQRDLSTHHCSYAQRSRPIQTAVPSILCSSQGCPSSKEWRSSSGNICGSFEEYGALCPSCGDKISETIEQKTLIMVPQEYFLSLAIQ